MTLAQDGYHHQEQYKLHGNWINNNDVHLMSKRTSPALSQRKINENQGVAAARESVQRLYAEIKQRLPFSLGKEKLFFGEYTCKRYMLRILFLKYSLN